MPPKHENSQIRLAELIAALSIATELGMGQPMEYALCSCVLAVRLGEKLGLSEEELYEVYYQALLRYIGCNVETHTLAALMGDEIAIRQEFATVDTADTRAIVSLGVRYIRQTHGGGSKLHLARMLVQSLWTLSDMMQQSFAGHCEVAQRLAGRMGFSGNVIIALGQLYERWDGKGLPGGLKGEEIATAVLVVTLAHDMVIFHRLEGVEAAIAVAGERKNTTYAPWVADCFCQHAPQLMAGLETEPSWEMVLALEPGPRPTLAAEQFDAACQALADFVDIKTPYTMGHSHRVADLAAEAARRSGLPEAEVNDIRRAGWLHDIGRTGVSAGIWMKQGPLTEKEWEQVRLHPYYTERILARPPALARLGAIAALHHEKLDGSGYHRGLPAEMQPPAARILAAANTYQTKTEGRPHRPPLSSDEAAIELKRQVRQGQLDSEVVNHVLAAAGHRVPPVRRELVAGLSERQIEVLRLLTRGLTIKQMAEELIVSPKTVDNHIQHIYNKIGVSTRAGATLFAVEQNLL
jgi:HD-GYP domain-containing protein (c-di-GMP phosphodiesterase class II)